MIKEPVHSHWVPEGAVGGLREIYFPEDGIKIIHQFQYIPEPEKSDLGDSDKENVPPEHPYEETPLEREIFGGSDDSKESDPNHEADRRMGLLPRAEGSGETPDSPIYIPRTPSPRSPSPEDNPHGGLQYPSEAYGQLSQSFCDTLPDYPEGHFITVHRIRMHEQSNYYGTRHGPYCICRGRAMYNR